MSARFFTERLTARATPPTLKLLRAIVKERKKDNKKVTRSDVIRIALIRLGKMDLGDEKVAAILNGGKR